MEQKPKISVIIPIYNIEDCLERCVESVKRQSYTKLEILLVDDGSTDGTGALCDRLGETDERIRVFHKENGGSSSARNLGIREATGDYLAFVDSDDFIDEDMYALMMQAAEATGAGVVQISRDEIDENGKRRPDVCVPPKEAFWCGSQEFLRELLLHRGDCSFCTKLLERRLLTDKAFPEGKLNEDFYLFLQVLSQVEGVYVLPQQCYHVFYRMGSNTRKKEKDAFSRVFLDIVENADYVQRLVEECYPALRQEAVRFGLYQRLDYLLHIPVSRMVRDNEFYRQVRTYLRSHIKDSCLNPYLTGKNKVYLLLLTAAPKTVRRVHGLWMRMRGY